MIKFQYRRFRLWLNGHLIRFTQWQINKLRRQVDRMATGRSLREDSPNFKDHTGETEEGGFTT